MAKNSFWSHRVVRLGASVALGTILLSQMPLSSLFSTPALGQAAPVYTNTDSDDSSGFLGISGRDAAEGLVLVTLGIGVYSAFHGGAGEANAAAAAAGNGPSGAAPASNATPLPNPASSGDEGHSLWNTLQEDRYKRFTQFTNVAEINEIKENPLNDQQSAPYTVFAPTDTAFAALPAGEQNKLTDKMTLAQNKADNQKLLLRHVVLGKYSVRDLEKLDNGFPLATASGDTLTITHNPDGTVNVNGVPVTREDIKASNGVSHPVPAVAR